TTTTSHPPPPPAPPPQKPPPPPPPLTTELTTTHHRHSHEHTSTISPPPPPPLNHNSFLNPLNDDSSTSFLNHNRHHLLLPTWNPIAGHKSMRASSSICKRSTMARRLLLRKGIGFLTPRTGLKTWSASDFNIPRTFPRWRAQLLEKDEMLRLQGLGSNTSTGMPYTEDKVMAIVRRGKQQGHILGVGRVLPGQGTVKMFMKLFRSDDKFSQMLTQLESQPEYGGGSRSGGCGDDEPGDDEDGDEDDEDEEDADS
ncbi:hypothetical protein Tco_1299392, partial [Tanacetum coccineum]